MDEVSADLLALLAQVQAYAAANGLSPTEVAAQLLSLLSNNAPADDVAPAPDSPEPMPTERPRSVWHSMTRRQLDALRRVNQRRMAETAPASNVAAALAYQERVRAEILAVLERKTMLPSALRELLADALFWSTTSKAGLSDVEATLGWMRAVTRTMEPLASEVPWPFDHVNAVCRALEAAMDGNMGPLQQALPVRDPKAGHPISSTTDDECKALIAGAVAGLVLGGEKANGLKNPTLAGKAMHGLLNDAGFACGEQTPRQYHSELAKIGLKPAAKRSQRETDLLARYQEVEATARNHLKAGPWPVEARLIWAATIAAKGATL